jgi:hypothetical protein
MGKNPPAGRAGKTGKYFKYAIGEIVLVVIGILIALSINNWNENRKRNKIKRNYYNQVLQDLSKDTSYINKRIKVLNSNVLLYENYNEEFPKQENIEKVIASQVKLNYFFIPLTFNTNTTESLESTGDIKLMPPEIRNKLIDLKNLQFAVIEGSSGNNVIFLRDFMSAVNLGYAQQVTEAITSQNYQLISELNVRDNFPKIVLLLNGAFGLKNVTEKDQLVALKSMLGSIDNLSKLIKAELKK